MASSRPDSTPICRCRVLYLGSAVPHITKDGLQGIQEPLRELYPEQGALGARGIDSWLSVWSNGILLENVDENHKKVTRFFPIETLHYCAAVRYVLVPEKSPVASSSQPRFLPLDSPFARSPNPDHPPLFACILRRTTGIKVLECHTFICKREMAANALVRCCFHAYADSAYARHMDSGGNPNSVYGTLRREENNQEGWRSPVGGSTLTLDSALHSSPRDDVDDASLYNGDENHKIWAGSVRDVSEDPVYGEYSGDTVRSGRSSRPRQSVNAPPPPPPPAKEEKRTKKAEKERARRKKMTGGSREEMYPLMNGSLLRSNTVSSRGSAFYRHYSDGTMRGGGPPYPGPVVMVPATLPHPRPGKTPPLLVVPPPFVGHPMYPRRPSRHHVEEPVYMPSNRPMSPVSSYQPCHFPHEAYLMRQYAAEDPKRKNKRDKRSVEPKRERDEWSEYSRRNKEDDSESPCEAPSRRTKRSDEEEGESPYDTGIYRRKGHLNERAFSYSIRQEHRSRSYGSLANLKFAPLPVVPNGGGPPPEAQYYASKEEMKKEREIMQMMRDLELSGDELERSEVPAGVYRQARQRSAKIRR